MRNYNASIIILLILCFGCYSKKQYINENKETVIEKKRKVKFSKYGKVIIKSYYKDSVTNKTEFIKRIYYEKTTYNKTIFYLHKKYMNKILYEKTVILENGDAFLYTYLNGKFVKKEKKKNTILKAKN